MTAVTLRPAQVSLAEWRAAALRALMEKSVIRPLRSSAPIERVRARLRAQVPHLDEDRYLAPDIAAAADLVRSGAVVEAAGVELPELW